MKILQIWTGFPTGDKFGTFRYAEGLARGLSDLGHSVHRLTPGGAERQSFHRHGVWIHSLGQEYPFVGYNDTLQATMDSLPLTDGLIRLWAQHGPFDAVIAHDWTSGLSGASAQRIFDVPLLAVLHGCQRGRCGAKGTKEEGFIADMERWLCECSDHVVVESEPVRGDVCEHYGVGGDSVSIVPGSVDVSAFKAGLDREEFRKIFATPAQKIVLFSGRLVPAKGPDLLLDSLLYFFKTSPEARVVFAGDGPMKEALMKRAATLGVADGVRLTGTLGPLVMSALYQVADVLVQPSRYEGLGLSALEGLLHGLPVLASGEGGHRELAKDFGDGRMEIVSTNPQDLAGAIANSLGRARNAGERSALAERIPLRYRCEAAGEAVVKILESIPARTVALDR